MTDIPHGSAAGYRLGCRSKGGCRFHQSADVLTCVEAATARRGDAAIAKLPIDAVIPRRPITAPVEPVAPPPTGDSRVHGTRWGYRRGCRTDRECRNWLTLHATCAQAHRAYMAEYRARRLAGEGPPIPHGTARGYLMGCRDRDRCGRGAGGVTCADARNTRKRELARARGIQPPTPTVSAAQAARRLRELQANGLSVRRIAELTGVGRSTLNRIASESDPSEIRIAVTTLNRIVEGDNSLISPRRSA